MPEDAPTGFHLSRAEGGSRHAARYMEDRADVAGAHLVANSLVETGC
jgi:hypothetical protein